MASRSGGTGLNPLGGASVDFVIVAAVMCDHVECSTISTYAVCVKNISPIGKCDDVDFPTVSGRINLVVVVSTIVV